MAKEETNAWQFSILLQRNYRLYLLFVFSALAFYTFMFPFTIIRIRANLDSIEKGFFRGLVYFPGTYAFAALCFLAVCLLAGLLAFNAFLVTNNKVCVCITCNFHYQCFKYPVIPFFFFYGITNCSPIPAKDSLALLNNAIGFSCKKFLAWVNSDQGKY